MTRAEEKAMRAYADHEGFFFEDERKAYVKGYEQAEKDTIDRAFKWLCTHHTFDTEEQAQFYAAAFKKAMEKEEQ